MLPIAEYFLYNPRTDMLPIAEYFLYKPRTDMLPIAEYFAHSPIYHVEKGYPIYIGSKHFLYFFIL